jgi:hypothetical protein
MAEFIYSTSSTLGGPWLIDAERLEALDEILGEHQQRLSERNQGRKALEVDQLLKDDWVLSRIENLQELEERTKTRKKELEDQIAYRFEESRTMTLRLDGDKKVRVNSFSEAQTEPSLTDQIVTGFQVELRSGDVTAEVDLRRPNYLSITVSPQTLTNSTELFAVLKRWADSCRAPKWQQVWWKFKGLQWFSMLFIFYAFIFSFNDAESISKATYKLKASQMLADGINQNNQQKAIEILLALDSGYVPPTQSSLPLFPFWLKLVAFTAVVICVVLTFTPKSLVGIGKGEERINRWRIWMRIIFIVVPTILIVDILLPNASSYLFRH